MLLSACMQEITVYHHYYTAQLSSVDTFKPLFLIAVCEFLWRLLVLIIETLNAVTEINLD